MTMLLIANADHGGRTMTRPPFETDLPRRRALHLRIILAVVLAAATVLAGAAPAQADFDPDVRRCRAAIGKNAARLASTMLKAVTSCHRKRDRDGSLAATDCNRIAAADARAAVPKAEQKFRSSLSSPVGRCAGLTPSDALYEICPAPCDSAVGNVATFEDVADCLTCLAGRRVEALSEGIHGTPASPLPSADRRCETIVGSASARLFHSVLQDATRCQVYDESAGSMSVEYCTGSGFPSPAVENSLFAAENAIVKACALPSFANLDSCAETAFDVAYCVGEGTLESARSLVADMLSLTPDSTTTTTTTTTTTSSTTTTMPDVVGDPQCPDIGELVTLSHDTNIPCTTNSDCSPPHSCDATAGICVSLSSLDSGWTGHAHHSDVDDGAITRSRLLCPGPAPVCGECAVAGVDPSTGSCRCANDNRVICDRPFQSDANDCGGAACECYYGVPIPLSSGGTPACILNRYAEDITGTVNVDSGASSINAHLRTKVYLGITTLKPCPVCAGTCSHNASATCFVDADCGDGNHCNQDIPNDGIRAGRCNDGDNSGQTCDVGGTNPSFPARSGAVVGGGGYSLDCMPSVGVNISGAGLDLHVTQSTGTSTLEANLPCTGGSCPCKTCSASPSTPCNSDSQCEGGSCALSSNFPCTSDPDCSNLDLGTCTGIRRCSLATSVTCTTNADCKNYPSGGPCNASTCSALGTNGQAPAPNACTGGSCSDVGDGRGECTTGPDDRTCDGLVRADGSGILACATNDDCQANSPLNGNCTLLRRRPCFLHPIVATGVADDEFPVGAAAFCVPPTSNSSINQVAGLPGPARILNQARSRALCAGDRSVEYQAGIGGCPP